MTRSGTEHQVSRAIGKRSTHKANVAVDVIYWAFCLDAAQGHLNGTPS